MENPIELFNAFLGVLEKVSQISENLKVLGGLDAKELFAEAQKHTIFVDFQWCIQILPKKTEQEKTNEDIRRLKEDE